MNRLEHMATMVALMSIAILLAGCGKEYPATQARGSLDNAMQNVSASRFPEMKAAKRKQVLDQLNKSGQVYVLEITEVVSPVEMRLADGRALRLAYLGEPENQQKRKEAIDRLKHLCVNSNYIVMTPSRANSEGYVRNVLEDSPQRMVAVVSVYAGEFILADLGMFMLEERLASIDPVSGFEHNALYKAEAKYLRENAPH